MSLERRHKYLYDQHVHRFCEPLRFLMKDCLENYNNDTFVCHDYIQSYKQCKIERENLFIKKYGPKIDPK
jgi:hypothetical protein